MMDILIGLAGIILLFFLPGFMLALAIFPKRGALDTEFDLIFKAVLGVLLSLIIAVSIGILLEVFDFLGENPLIESAPLWIILGLLSIFLGVIAWIRGGLKEFLNEVRSMRIQKKKVPEDELSRLVWRKRELQARLIQMTGPEYLNDEALRQEAEVRIPLIKREISEISAKIDALLREEEKGDQQTIRSEGGILDDGRR